MRRLFKQVVGSLLQLSVAWRIPLGHHWYNDDDDDDKSCAIICRRDHYLIMNIHPQADMSYAHQSYRRQRQQIAPSKWSSIPIGVMAEKLNHSWPSAAKICTKASKRLQWVAFVVASLDCCCWLRRTRLRNQDGRQTGRFLSRSLVIEPSGGRHIVASA